MTVPFAPPAGERVDAPAPGARWRIAWRGRVWSESDLTGGHLAFVALLNGVDDWSMFDLRDLSPAKGPVRLMNLIAAFMAVDAGMDAAEPDALTRIIREVGEAPAAELLDAVRFD